MTEILTRRCSGCGNAKERCCFNSSQWAAKRPGCIACRKKDGKSGKLKPANRTWKSLINADCERSKR